MAKRGKTFYTSGTMKCLVVLPSLFLSVATLLPVPASAESETVSLPLQRSASSVRFGVSSPSPALTMKGSFRDFGGHLLLDPHGFERSTLSLSLDLSSAQLPPEQLLQALFIQTTLARFQDRSGDFQSSSILPISGNRYLVRGTYSWANKRREAAVPVEVLKLSRQRSEIRFLLDGAVRPQDVKPPVSELAPGIAGSEGWAKAVLVFAPHS